jgi:hypothetical protein
LDRPDKGRIDVSALRGVSPPQWTEGGSTGNLLVGPPIAMFDRIRDAVRDWRTKNPDD